MTQQTLEEEKKDGKLLDVGHVFPLSRKPFPACLEHLFFRPCFLGYSGRQHEMGHGSDEIRTAIRTGGDA